GRVLASELVAHGERFDGSAVGGGIEDEVQGPDVVGALRPQPLRGDRARPHPPALGRPLRHPQSLLAPQPLNPLAVHHQTLQAEQAPGLTEPVPRPRPGDLAQPGPQLLLRRQHWPRWTPLGSAVLADRPARPTLRDGIAPPQVIDRLPSARRAQNFPRATSLSISMSSAWSATIRFSRRFSSFSRRSSLASSAFIPPSWLRHRPEVGSLTPSSLATSATLLPSPSIRSASRSLRTICSGVCLLPFNWGPPGPCGRWWNPHITWTSSRGSGQLNLFALHSASRRRTRRPCASAARDRLLGPRRGGPRPALVRLPPPQRHLLDGLRAPGF